MEDVDELVVRVFELPPMVWGGCPLLFSPAPETGGSHLPWKVVKAELLHSGKRGIQLLVLSPPPCPLLDPPFLEALRPSMMWPGGLSGDA